VGTFVFTLGDQPHIWTTHLSELCSMSYLKGQWEKYKTKSVWSKITDLIYLLFFIVIITPSGRIWLQTSLLQLGLFSSTEVNDATQLSLASLQWKLTDLEGNTVTLEELKGEVLFINFWSTWCGPCTAEMPTLMALREKMQGKVTFIFAAHESPTVIQQYLERKEWSIPVYIYDRSPGEEITAGSLPSNFIIDRRGNVVHRSSGMKKWDTSSTIELLNGLVEAE
jgi:thiol-disulfide isomerase/thioredoxin